MSENNTPSTPPKAAPSDKKTIMKQRIQLYGSLLIILLACVAVIYTYRSITISRSGALLTPKEPVAALNVGFVPQNDPAYAEEPMGQTGYTIGQEGSLLCCLSMAAKTQGVAITPSQLNNDALYEDNTYRLDKLDASGTLPGAKLNVYKVFDEKKVRELLRSGKPVLARVLREGNVRWLLLVGGEQDTHFLMLDPSGEGTPQPLTEPVFALGELVIR